ncbi:MAG: hypothetical protein AB1644_07205 [Candidatus Zixiibacteriota bacterium]
MLKKLSDTTAYPALGVGAPPGRKLFRIVSGAYAGRQVAVFRTSASDIALAFADAPYSSWSSLQMIASDAADGSIDVVMDSAGNLHVVYPESGTNYLVTRKLAFGSGAWTVGAKVVIFNGNQCFDPSIAIEPGGKLWVNWSRFASPNRYVHVKSSSDSGASWGTGPTDSGQALSTGAVQAFSKVLVATNDLHVIYTYGGSGIAIRSVPLAGGAWSDEYLVATGTSGFSEHFDAAIGPDGGLGLVFNDSQLRYREFDSRNWGALVTLDSGPGYSPQLLFRESVPVIFYLCGFVGTQAYMKYVERRSGEFSAPAILDTRAKTLDSMLLFSQSAGSYVDVTAAAANGTSGDVFHPATGSLVSAVGDCLYLGMTRPFRYAEFLLSTSGAGGTLSFSYWDGNHWVTFTPANGLSYLNSSDVRILFFSDYASIPADWQQNLLSGHTRFWIKIEVTAAFTTAPIGSQISAISTVQRMIVRR